MKRGPSPTSTTAEHLLGGVQRVRTRVRGFAPWSPEKATLALLDQVRGILDEYGDHLPLTIRQIFYRLVGAHDYEKSCCARTASTLIAMNCSALSQWFGSEMTPPSSRMTSIKMMRARRARLRCSTRR